MPETPRAWLRRIVFTVALVAIVVPLVFDREGGGPGTDRVASISARLRCPVCQGESIADSPAGVAVEMRGVVREQVAEGRTDAEIEGYFRQRYGQWVLLDPPARGSTLVLWALPAVGLAAGVGVVVAFWFRRRSLGDDDVVDVDAEAGADLDVAAEPALDAGAGVATAAVAASRGPGWLQLVVVGTACGFIGIAVAAAVEPDTATPHPEPEVAAASPAGRDLASVSEAEMEQVIARNPNVVPMRLALVERYLRKGELQPADGHAKAALELATEPADRQRALKFAGWTTALLGAPAEGAALLDESLSMQPDDLDAMWFLASVRLTGLGDATGAATLLETLLRHELPADKRSVVEAKLADARGRG